MLRLRTLGRLSLERDGEPITGAAAQRRPLALLAQVASAGRQGVARTKVVARLWPESDEERARNVLAQTVYALRRDLRADDLFVPGAGGELRLNPAAITSDVAEFDEAVAAGRWESAAELYAGPFLDGFFLPGAPEFERWVEEERSRLASVNARVLTTLARAAAGAGDHTAAAGWWRRLAAADPLNSGVALSLMRALADAGDRGGAIQHARVHEALLRAELDAAPDPEIVAFAERLRSGPVAASSAPAPATVVSAAPPAAAPPRDVAADASLVPPPPPAPTSPSPRATPASPRHVRRRVMAAAALGVLAVAVAGAASLRPLLARRAPADAPPGTASAGSQPMTVAVLGFANLSPDTLDAYLAQGIGDEIGARLGKLNRLRVKSLSGARRLRDSALADPVAAARALGVRYVVDGSLRRAGDRVRVTVRLVRGEDGFQGWAEDYDASSNDLLALQDTIARQVATALGGRITDAEGSTLARHVTQSPAAYDHFLRGNYLLDGRTPATVQRAIAEYEAALRIDTTFVAARARIAYCYAMAYEWGWRQPGIAPESLLAAGLALSARALAEDSTSAEAWLVRAYLLVQRDPKDLRGAPEAFAHALALDSTNAEAYHQYGQALMILGRDDEAEAAYKRALALDPRRAITLVPLAAIARNHRRWADSKRWFDSAVAVGPAVPYAYAARGTHHILAGAYGAAAVDAQTALRLDSSYEVPAQSVLAHALAAVGDTAAARLHLARAVRAMRDPLHPSATDARFVAAAQIGLGERYAALDLISRVRPRGAWLWFYMGDTVFTPLRGDPRFERVVEAARPAGARRSW